jgi:hypothetical protein
MSPATSRSNSLRDQPTADCSQRVIVPTSNTPVVRIYSIATIDAHAKPMWHHQSVIVLFQMVVRLLIDLIALTALAFRQQRASAAEILVLRRQIALYQERGIKRWRIDPVTRISFHELTDLLSETIAAVPVECPQCAAAVIEGPTCVS